MPINPELAPYLHPDHWDGHTLGVGESRPKTVAFWDHHDASFAKPQINALDPRNITFLHTFQSGEIFAPDRFEPGTVVLFSLERAEGQTLNEEELAEVMAQPPAARPAPITSPYFNGRPNITRVQEDSSMRRTYAHGVRWGVTSPPGAEDCIVVTTAWHVSEHNNKVRLLGAHMLTRMEAPITIGETVHHKLESGNEAIYRVGLLHVITHGVRKRSTQKARHFVPGWVHRPSTT